MGKQYDAGVDELLALRGEAFKAIEADPVVREVYEVFNDQVFMMDVLPKIWQSWGVREMGGWVRIKLGMPHIMIPMHLRVNSPLWSQEFVGSQADLSDRPNPQMVELYKESISVSPILTGLMLESKGNEEVDPASPLYQVWQRVVDESKKNPNYGGSKCGSITLWTPEDAYQYGLLKLMVGTNCLTGGFAMAAVEISPRTGGESRIQTFSSYEAVKVFFAQPYQNQRWDPLEWNDYYRAVFKVGEIIKKRSKIPLANMYDSIS